MILTRIWDPTNDCWGVVNLLNGRIIGYAQPGRRFNRRYWRATSPSEHMAAASNVDLATLALIRAQELDAA